MTPLADSDYLLPTRSESLTYLATRIDPQSRQWQALGSRPTRRQLADELAARGWLNDVAHDSTLRRALRGARVPASELVDLDGCQLTWLAIQNGLLPTAEPVCLCCIGDRQVPCATCDGNGRHRKPHTDKRGRVYHREGPCGDCDASGRVGCPDCGGCGFVRGPGTG
jgi:hypothetical protein